jgi:hypothetical protein
MKFSSIKSPFIGFVLMSVIVYPCFALELGARHFEQEGGFSYQPPNGWKISEIPGLKFKGVFGPPDDGFSPNINFVDQEFSGSLQDYAEVNLKALQSTFKGFKKLSQAEFITNSGAIGVKLVTQAEQSGKLLHQIYYFFDLPKGVKLVVTCSALATSGNVVGTVFDETLRSLILKK